MPALDEHASPLEQLGAAVRELRECHGVAQQDVADRASLSRDDLAAIERGALDPSYMTLVAIAQAVPASLLELFQLLDQQRGS